MALIVDELKRLRPGRVFRNVKREVEVPFVNGESTGRHHVIIFIHAVKRLGDFTLQRQRRPARQQGDEICKQSKKLRGPNVTIILLTFVILLVLFDVGLWEDVLNLVGV